MQRWITWRRLDKRHDWDSCSANAFRRLAWKVAANKRDDRMFEIRPVLTSALREDCFQLTGYGVPMGFDICQVFEEYGQRPL